MSAAGHGPAGAARPRVAIFGGTFNPIHLGHLRAAEEAAELLGLERVLFVPSADPPHKEGRAADPLAPAALRLAWVRLAIEDNPRFAADPLEVERGGRSYSVDTLRALGARLAPERPVFLIGHDAFALIDTWRDPEAIFALAHVAVIVRPGASPGSLADWRPGASPGSLADWLPKRVREDVELAPDGRSAAHPAGTWIRVLEIAALDVSASDLRARLRAGRTVRYLLPESVREAVTKSGVYAGS
jgi:nicotinate-nucleotide adenylyltransferase